MPPEVWYAINMNEVKETEMKKTWTERFGEWGIRKADEKIERLTKKAEIREAKYGRGDRSTRVIQVRIDRLKTDRRELQELLDELYPCECHQ